MNRSQSWSWRHDMEKEISGAQWRSLNVGCPGWPLSLAPPKPIKISIAQ